MNTISIQRVGTAIAVVGSIVGTYFFTRSRTQRKSSFSKQRKEVDENLLTPANETFGIMWPTIYTGTTALAVHQALPDQLDNPRYQKAVPWLVSSYALNNVFTYFFAKDDLLSRRAAALTTIALLPNALMLHKALEIGKTNVPQPERTFQKSISLYAGWLTAASVISGGNLLLQSGIKIPESLKGQLTCGALSLTATLGIGVARKLNDPYYLIPFIAALAGIAAKQKNERKEVALCAATLAITVAGAFAKQLQESKPLERIEE
ncbi:tryptophan-rich sensory protein [Siphonobacter sp. SORGH_AS_1065]|uniref:tryptophan-rich sensory protein n=1 Tax=Siphonobacter sp. SORGH_AS_1065 TaxID=3041795 RepID=UPI00277E3213|nr:tryptophan-rich sensory protein [Siphonobacter sp. SORGH_AS_1065]MDQ1089324.1 tryptophan-rich sensory protein [Siphonobacter sp. SORGH_AS_1065]